MGLLLLYLQAAVLLSLGLGVTLTLRLLCPPRRGLGDVLGAGLPASPEDVGLADWSEERIRLPDGATTELWRIAGMDPQGPTVVISHGWGLFRHDLLERAAILAPVARELILYDLRAHGDSSARFGSVGRVEQEDLLAVLEATAPQGDLILMGCSMGARLTIPVAVRLTEDQTSRWGKQLKAVVTDGVYRWPEEPVCGFLWIRRYPPYPAVWLFRLFLELTTPGRYRPGDLAQWAKRLRAPLLVQHGRSDRLIPVRSSRQIAASAPQGRFVLYRDAHHLDMATCEPTRYRAVLYNFIAEAVGHRPAGVTHHPPDLAYASSAGEGESSRSPDRPLAAAATESGVALGTRFPD